MFKWIIKPVTDIRVVMSVGKAKRKVSEGVEPSLAESESAVITVRPRNQSRTNCSIGTADGLWIQRSILNIIKASSTNKTKCHPKSLAFTTRLVKLLRISLRKISPMC